MLHASSREIAARLRYGDYKERRLLLVTDLEGYDIKFGQPWLQTIEPTVNWKGRSLQFQFNGRAYTLGSGKQPLPLPPPTPTIAMISSEEMELSIQEREDDIFIAFIEEIVNPGMPDPNEGPFPAKKYQGLSKAFMERFEMTMEDYQDIFQPVPPGLPPQRAIDHAIEVEPYSKPAFMRTGKMTYLELEE